MCGAQWLEGKKIDKKAYIGVLKEIKSNDSVFYRILYTSGFFYHFSNHTDLRPC